MFSYLTFNSHTVDVPPLKVMLKDIFSFENLTFLNNISGEKRTFEITHKTNVVI
jgi:hypothetical protein